MSNTTRARSIGEILGGSFQLYRTNFSACMAAICAVLLPVEVVAALLDRGMAGALEEGGMGLAAFAAASAVADAVGSWFATTLLVVLLADSFLGSRPSLRTALPRAAARSLPIVGLSLLALLGRLGVTMPLRPAAAALGILDWLPFNWLLEDVASILLAMPWLLALPILALEGSGVWRSLRRSMSLTAGRWWRTAALLLIVSVLDHALGRGFHALLPEFLIRTPLAGALFSALPHLLVAPVSAAVLTLAYFDARTRAGEALAETVVA